MTGKNVQRPERLPTLSELRALECDEKALEAAIAKIIAEIDETRLALLTALAADRVETDDVRLGPGIVDFTIYPGAKTYTCGAKLAQDAIRSTTKSASVGTSSSSTLKNSRSSDFGVIDSHTF